MSSSDNTQNSGSPPPAQPRGTQQPAAQELIVVKFHDNIPLLDPHNVGQSISQHGVGPWDDIEHRYPGSTISPVMAKIWDRLDHHVQLAKARTPGYSPPNFKAYHGIRVAPGADAQRLITALRTWPAVEYAYIAHPPLLPAVNSGPNPCFPFQAYLQQSPAGIDAFYAWTVPGGDGAHQVFGDCESAYMVDHEDLSGQHITVPAGSDPMLTSTSQDYPVAVRHGTAVLGIIYGADNTIDGVGIVPNAQQCLFFPNTLNDLPALLPVVIVEALNVLEAGNVLLLELQSYQAGPIETLSDLWLQTIQLAVAQRVTIIEPAGNGGVDLDTWTDPSLGQPLSGKNWLNPASPDYVDSGAIMVGAGTAMVPHQVESFSSRGNRINCYAWGDTVWAYCDYDASVQAPESCDPYAASAEDAGTQAVRSFYFSGTSPASAIIAGAAIATQGMAQAQTGSPLSPDALRALLSLDIYGTQSANGTETDRIGVMPNLRAIAGHFGDSGSTATVVIRNQFGDALENVGFAVDAGGEQSTGLTDSQGNATIAISAPGTLTLDEASLLAALGDLLNQAVLVDDPGNAVIAVAQSGVPIELSPGDALEIEVVARADIAIEITTDLEGTIRVEGSGVNVAQDGQLARVALQVNDGSTATVFLDPPPPQGTIVNPPELTQWQPPNGYIVQPDDTADSLSQRFLGAPGQFDELSDHDPVAGEVLTLPDAAVPGWVDLAIEPLPPSPGPQTWFTVSPNDVIFTLYDVGGSDDALQQLLDAAADPPPADADPTAVSAYRAEAITAFLTLPSDLIVAEPVTSETADEGEGLDGSVG